MKDERFLGLLNAALEHEIGLAILCTSREAADDLRQMLYIARARAREQGELKFDSLTLSISPHASDILYVYRAKEDERG